jgi:hypothetical protein
LGTTNEKLCGALKSLVERNEVDVETMEWVERATAIEKVRGVLIPYLFTD